MLDIFTREVQINFTEHDAIKTRLKKRVMKVGITLRTILPGKKLIFSKQQQTQKSIIFNTLVNLEIELNSFLWL